MRLYLIQQINHCSGTGTVASLNSSANLITNATLISFLNSSTNLTTNSSTNATLISFPNHFPISFLNSDNRLLIAPSTVAKFATVQKEGTRTIERDVEYHNLDVIISVDYRVKSKRGTQFRQWATQRLKDYLVQGYDINEKRLAEKKQQVEYLKTGIKILSPMLALQCLKCQVTVVNTSFQRNVI